jgi:hypothetical protein
MKTLQLSDEKARKLCKTGSSELKEILEESFTKSFFSEKITDRVKSFEDACRVTGEEPCDNKFSSGTSDEIGYKKLKVVTRALNEEWQADYANGNQKKWYAWMEFIPGSGFRFFAAFYVVTFTRATGGSRLCFRRKADCEFAAKQFIDLYRDLMVIPK